MRVSLERTEKTPPASGLMTMEERRRILRVWGVGNGGEGLLPAVGDVDGEGPGFGEVGGLVGAALARQIAELAGEFIREVKGVAVEGARGGVHPDFWWSWGCGDDLAEEECGLMRESKICWRFSGV